jgi:hypothetical protein
MINPFAHKEVTAIIKQYETTGHSPYLVLTRDFEQFVLKGPLNINDSSIIKEFLCCQFLNLWGIVNPGSAILKLSESLASSEYVNGKKGLKLLVPYFGSSFISHSVDLQTFLSASDKVGQRRISNIEAILDIALFDIWVENDDRKPSNNNLILTPLGKSFQIMPIDNAFTFATMDFSSLNPEYVSFSDNDSIIHSPIGLAAVEKVRNQPNWEVSITENFYIRVEKSKEFFQQVVNNLPEEYALKEDEVTCLANFLFSEERNKMVLNQFKYIVATAK